MANTNQPVVSHQDFQNESEIRNLPQATANGMPVVYEQHNLKQDIMTVAPGSTSLLSIDPATSQISISSLAITSVKVDTTNLTIADFIADEYVSGNELQEGDLVVLTASTDFHQRNWIHNGGTAGDENDFTRLQADLDAPDVRAFFDAENVLRYDAGTGKYSVKFGNSTNELGAYLIPIDSSKFTANHSNIEDMLVCLEDLVQANDLAISNLSIAVNNRIDTIVGAGAGANHLGSFTGTNKPSVNSTIKEAIQSNIDNMDDLAAKDALLDTVLGVSASSSDMGNFTDTVTPDSASAKAVMQAHGTAIQTEIANRVQDVTTINNAITSNENASNAALALRTQMNIETINLTANTTLQVAHGFSTGYHAQVENQSGKIVYPEIVKTNSTVSITSEVDLVGAKLTLIGY
ncbi:MAG: hypothetical protein Unbinned6284contig1004_8 [Prokaryotic dsDNA virus sp.]|nr:MAG: hypothetical protein Unbinned6284contig1004_8 [Prokaryotic dsDNA virus sp.]|tara:strand:+ start:25567 stop:26784 length:1218 start_codon:yes stop_codon:yes gene_type:complete